jgi:hypothetical protein
LPPAAPVVGGPGQHEDGPADRSGAFQAFRPQANPVPWPSSCTSLASCGAGSCLGGPPTVTASSCWKAGVWTTSQPDRPAKLTAPVMVSGPSGSRPPRVQPDPQFAVVHTRTSGVAPLPGCQGMPPVTVSSRPWPEAENHGP